MKKNNIIIIIVVMLGAWVGSNLARDRDLFDNPFRAATPLEKLKGAGSNVLEDSVDAIKDGVDKLTD